MNLTKPLLGLFLCLLLGCNDGSGGGGAEFRLHCGFEHASVGNDIYEPHCIDRDDPDIEAKFRDNGEALRMRFGRVPNNEAIVPTGGPQKTVFVKIKSVTFLKGDEEMAINCGSPNANGCAYDGHIYIRDGMPESSERNAIRHEFEHVICNDCSWHP